MQTKRRGGALALGAILALGLILSIAGTRSTLKAPQPGAQVLVAPEQEGIRTRRRPTRTSTWTSSRAPRSR